MTQTVHDNHKATQAELVTVQLKQNCMHESGYIQFSTTQKESKRDDKNKVNTPTSGKKSLTPCRLAYAKTLLLKKDINFF